MTRLQVINQYVNEENPTTIVIPYNAVRLPVRDGCLAKVDEANSEHYATIVFDCKDKKFAVLEFSRRVHTGIAAYARRHNLNEFRIIVSRYPDGRLKLTSGDQSQSNKPFSDEQEEAGYLLNNQLFESYMDRKMYQVHDKE